MVEPLDDTKKRRLAATGLADDNEELTGFDLEVDVFEHHERFARVLKVLPRPETESLTGWLFAALCDIQSSNSTGLQRMRRFSSF